VAQSVFGGTAAGRAGSLPGTSAASRRGQQEPTAGPPLAKVTEEPLTVLKSGPEHVRAVYNLKNKPATDTSYVLQQLFRAEGRLHGPAATTAKSPAGAGVAIIPSVIDNSLLISGPPESVEEVRALLDKIDQPRGMLSLEMELGAVPFGDIKPAERPEPKAKSSVAGEQPLRLLARPAKMETVAHARLIALDNQPAFVQLGSRVPRVNNLSASSAGGETRSITLDNVGVIVGVTSRINPDGMVTMLIDVEQGHVGPENEGTPISVAGGRVVRAPRIEASTVQTTIRIRNGQPIILASAFDKGKSDKELVIILTPHIIWPEEARKVR